MTATALATRNLSKAFGGLEVTQRLDFSLLPGARHALIGPNGAGKTTLVNLLTGTLRPSSGTVELMGEDVTRLRADQRVKRGLARTFQINSLFPRLTPLEAVTLALCEHHGLGRQWFKGIATQSAIVDEAHALLVRLGLQAGYNRLTRELAYGDQRLLEIALALASQPKVLVLDEPAAGIPKPANSQLFDAIAALPRDVSILFIEHDMDIVFRFAEWVTVLVAGRILVEGAPAEVAADERVREVYLGKAAYGRSHRGI